MIRSPAYHRVVATPDPPPDRNPLPFDRKANPMLRAARYTGAGLEFAVAVGLFTWIGHWADGRLGSDPWGTVVGALVGVAAGTWILVRPFLLPPRKGGDEGEQGG
jgi:ATP synthase protein I